MLLYGLRSINQPLGQHAWLPKTSYVTKVVTVVIMWQECMHLCAAVAACSWKKVVMQ